MNNIDLNSIVNDLQKLIYSRRDTSMEENSISAAYELQCAFDRATSEFARPAISIVNGKIKNGAVLDQQLRLLKVENRDLQREIENITSATEHVLSSHRKTMEAVLRGLVPSPSGDGWMRHPLERLLATDERKCEVQKHTPSEEQEHLQVFAAAIKQIAREGDNKFEGQREMTERVAFENYVMRHLLDNKDEKLDYEELLRSFREVTPTPKKEDEMPVFTHADLKKASEHFEGEFWAEHERDRIEMEEKAFAEEERKRKEQEREEGASVVEGLLRQYQRK